MSELPKLIAVECLIDLYSPWGITARQAKAAFLIEGTRPKIVHVTLTVSPT